LGVYVWYIEHNVGNTTNVGGKEEELMQHSLEPVQPIPMMEGAAGVLLELCAMAKFRERLHKK